MSPDAMTISISFFYLAYILHLAFDNIKTISGKQKVFLAVLSIILALCKIVYLPLLLLLFLIPTEKWGINKSKQWVNIIGIGGIASFLNLAWLKFSGRYLTNFREGDSHYQLMLLFKHPFNFIGKVIYTLNDRGDKYITTMLGSSLGWGEFIQIKFLVPFTMFVLIIIGLFFDNEMRNKLNKTQKLILIGTFLIIFLLIFTTLFIQWTYVGTEIILGIQGRYFIPILTLLLLTIGSTINLKTKYNSEGINKTVAIVGLLINIITIITIVIVKL